MLFLEKKQPFAYQIRMAILCWQKDHKNYMIACMTLLILAMAQGLPVIVTSRGGMAEYIRKSRAGIVVSPDSATAIINAVTIIINQYDSYSSQAFLFANLNSRNSIVASRIAQFIDYSFQKSSYCEDYTLYK